jgi:hypothetical protein
MKATVTGGAGLLAALFSIFALIFFGPMIGVLAGAFSGWVVGWLAPVWVPSGLALIGIKVAARDLLYLGAALGFVGGFFKSSNTNNCKG